MVHRVVEPLGGPRRGYAGIVDLQVQAVLCRLTKPLPTTLRVQAGIGKQNLVLVLADYQCSILVRSGHGVSDPFPGAICADPRHSEGLLKFQKSLTHCLRVVADEIQGESFRLHRSLHLALAALHAFEEFRSIATHLCSMVLVMSFFRQQEHLLIILLGRA
jgi:hypothetical protein